MGLGLGKEPQRKSNTMKVKEKVMAVLCWPLTLLCKLWNDAGGPNYSKGVDDDDIGMFGTSSRSACFSPIYRNRFKTSCESKSFKGEASSLVRVRS